MFPCFYHLLVGVDILHDLSDLLTGSAREKGGGGGELYLFKKS